MPHISDNVFVERGVYIAVAFVLLYVGYRFGKWIGSVAARGLVAQKEQELFTAQRGFKTLYENELNVIRTENESLKSQVTLMTAKVEEYRKKAAGLGGLFNSGGKKADAMYALLLENESLEEALYNQNEKLKQERTDALKEQIRNTGYRRVLMSQLLSDERIKSYVQEVLADERQLPSPRDARNGDSQKALPSATVDDHA